MSHNVLNPSEPCNCETCKNMCRRPCWPTPEDAKRLIDSGYAEKLMLDKWIGGFDDSGEDVFLLCPANPGYETSFAPITRLHSGCTFFDNGNCTLHDLGLKPTEGKAAHHSFTASQSNELHESVARTWDNPDAQRIVEEWKTLVNYDEMDSQDDFSSSLDLLTSIFGARL